MFWRKKLKDIYSKYNDAVGLPFGQQKTFDLIPEGKQKYKSEILDALEEAIKNKDKNGLEFCIGSMWRDGIDKTYSNKFHEIILETWHNSHEDIVDIVRKLNEDRFSDALFKIAMDPVTYRQFDDENEATLRKCVHALRELNSPKSNELLIRIIETENPNVKFALGIHG